MLRHVFRLAAAALLCLTLSCSKDDTASTASAADSDAGNVLRFINRGDIITLDLNQMSYLQDFRITYGIREGLYTYEPQTLAPLPALCVDEQISEDQRTWRFGLRRDAVWSNGDPVTAHDFVFSWRHMLESPGEYTYLFYYIEGAEAYEKAYADGSAVDFNTQVGIRAVDDHTLEVRLANPVLFLRDLLAFPPFYPRHEKSMAPFREVNAETGKVSYRAEYTRPPQVVTNGPFMLTEWEFNRRLVLTRSPTYWDRDNVRLDQVVMVVNNDPLSAFQMYEQGEVDWVADVAPDIAEGLRKRGRSDLRICPAFGTAFLTVNCAERVPGYDFANPLADMRVRQALHKAIDRKALVETVTRMGEPPALSYVPPDMIPGYSVAPGLPESVPDAKRLLAEAGYPDGKGFPRLTLLYNTSSPVRRDLCQFLRSQWQRNLGIEVEIQGQELKSYRTSVTTKQYLLAAAAWYGDYTDVSTFTDKYHSKALNNDSNWGPPEYDALLLQASQEIDPARRHELLRQAEAMINEQLPIIPLYNYVNYMLFRDNVKGLYMNPKVLTVFKPVYVER